MAYAVHHTVTEDLLAYNSCQKAHTSRYWKPVC
jgi:hypothetical protein